MQNEISWLPVRKQFNWRLLLSIWIAFGIVMLMLFTLFRYQFRHGMPSVNGVLQVDLETLGDFVFDRDTGTSENIPQRFRDLDGKKVALEGFMWTGHTSGERIHAFQFLNVTNKNIRKPPLVQGRVFVYVPNGRAVDYYGDKCRIIGMLHVKVERDSGDGRVDSIYTMDLDHVERLKP